MAERVEIATVNTPAGTAIATPQITALTWRQGYPVQVEFRVPPGPSGLLGIQLAHSGVVIVPHNANEWLVTDDEVVIWPFSSLPYNVKYTVRTYNLDVFPHSFQLRMLMNEIGSQQIARMQPEPILPLWQSAGVGGEGI